MSEEHGVRFRLGRFEIRPAQRQVLEDGERARVGARAFDILLALIDRRDRVVGSGELLDLVWPGTVVEENNLQVHISALRKLLGREVIVTVPGRGYRFAAPLQATGPDASSDPSPAPWKAPDPLPLALTSFVGRERDIEQLLQLSARSRLVVLTGAGGCGKSRLSIELARRLLPELPDGVCLVELAALTDPALVAPTVAKALGLADSAGRPAVQRVAEHLAARRMLLLIDNAEHLLPACAALVDTVLQLCPGVSVLITSRERLGITGEFTYRVPSLRVPDAPNAHEPCGRQDPLDALAACEAVRLFVERAQLQLPQFTLTAQNAAAVVAICRRLDGIPLAIELAAARLRSLSVAEVTQRLDQRFDLLTGGSRTALPRQQTLRALIDWSFDLLDAQEQALLCRLTVFAGGWSAQAAERVCNGPGLAVHDVLPVLTALADKSLLLAEDRGGTTRYRMLESVWHYAHEALHGGEDAAHWRARHGACFTALAETAAAALKGTEQGTWLDVLALEHDNLRLVLAATCAAGGDAGSGLRLVASLWLFWRRRGHSEEGLGWARRQLAAVDECTPPLLHANALTAAGQLAFDMGDPRSASSAHTQALAIYRRLGDRAATASALHSLGAVAFLRADYAAAQGFAEQSLAIRREAGDPRGIAGPLHSLAALAAARGDLLDARALYEEGISIYRAAGDLRDVAWGLVYLGVVVCHLDNIAGAALHFAEALELARQVGDRPTMAAALLNLGNVAFEQGELALAAGHFTDSLVLTQQLGDLYDMAELLFGMARLRAACGQARFAGQLFGAALRLREGLEAPVAPGARDRHEQRVKAARAGCGDGILFDLGWQEGLASTLNDVIRGLPALPPGTLS